MDLASKHCVPCEGGTPPLSEETVRASMKEIDGAWSVRDHTKLVRTFAFPSFRASLQFTQKVSDCAEKEGHHPDIQISYTTVTLTLWTHAIGGLSENDFILARKIDLLF
ncbi:MAG: 4a-hydroxytetrahydrobiopterin dehydratase [Parcubacteria group bacterium]|nr:4a-hydroxytetrahydrobiopterin dehydratase [Parcubacteria group bacterium]